MEKQFYTRFDEVKMRVSDPKHMIGKMLAEKVFRHWMEDFMDEDTGEIVSVERTEYILDRGRILTDEDVATIQFHIQAGDIKDVLVTNQPRIGYYDPAFTPNYFEAVLTNGSNKHRVLVYARGIPMAMQMVVDYAEQVMAGYIGVQSIKTTDHYEVISYTPNNEQDALAASKYYVVVISYVEEDTGDEIVTKYLTNSKDADMAIDIVRAFIDRDQERKDHMGNYEVKNAKESTITQIVPMSFSEEYIKNKTFEDWILSGESFGQIPA